MTPEQRAEWCKAHGLPVGWLLVRHEEIQTIKAEFEARAPAPPAAPAQVRIFKCSVFNAWYASRIGEIFTPFAKDSYGYWVRTGDTFNTSHWIAPQDAEVMPSTLPAPDKTAEPQAVKSATVLNQDQSSGAGIPPSAVPTDKLIEDMTNAFLRWPLPNSVCADLCTSMQGYQFPCHGTNLLNFTEARAMFSEVVLPLITPHAAVPPSTSLANLNQVVCGSCNQVADRELKCSNDHCPNFGHSVILSAPSPTKAPAPVPSAAPVTPERLAEIRSLARYGNQELVRHIDWQAAKIADLQTALNLAQSASVPNPNP